MQVSVSFTQCIDLFTHDTCKHLSCKIYETNRFFYNELCIKIIPILKKNYIIATFPQKILHDIMYFFQKIILKNRIVICIFYV